MKLITNILSIGFIILLFLSVVITLIELVSDVDFDLTLSWLLVLYTLVFERISNSLT